MSLSQAGSEAVTVAWATGGGTATAAGDHTEASGTLTFSPGDALTQMIAARSPTTTWTKPTKRPL